MKKILSLLVAIVLFSSLVSVNATSTSVTTPTSISETKFISGINYSNQAPLVASATVIYDSVVPEHKNENVCFQIDISNEAATMTGIHIAAYSLDGGSTWRSAFKPPKISNLLNNGGTLWIASTFDMFTRKPRPANLEKNIPGATIIKFPTIGERPKAEKLAVNYTKFADLYGNTSGAWTLAVRDGLPLSNQELSAIQIKEAKEELDVGWGVIDAEKGVNVQPYSYLNRVRVNKYKLRIAPKVVGEIYTVGSKPYNCVSSHESKPPKVRADYLLEKFRLKANMRIYMGTSTASITSLTKVVVNSASMTDDSLWMSVDSDSAFLGLDISKYLSHKESKVVTFWFPATEKKPASAKLVYKLAKRALMTVGETHVSCEEGRAMPSTAYEFYNADKAKWVKFFKIRWSNDTPGIPVRLKATEKGTGEDDSNLRCASYPGQYISNWIAYDSVYPTKLGASSAKIIGFEPPI